MKTNHCKPKSGEQKKGYLSHLRVHKLKVNSQLLLLGYPEQPTTVRGFKPQIDKVEWLLTQVVHNLTNQGYTNGLQLEVKLEELPE